MPDGIGPDIPSEFKKKLFKSNLVTLDPLHVTPVHGVHTGVTGTPPAHLQALKLVKVPILVEDMKSQKKVKLCGVVGDSDGYSDGDMVGNRHS